MKESKVYICEQCFAQYKSKAESIKCEESHIAIDGIAPKYTGANEYPYCINVKFANGRTKTYRLI